MLALIKFPFCVSFCCLALVTMARDADAAPTTTPYYLCSLRNRLSVRAACPKGAVRIGKLSDLQGAQGPQGPQGEAGPLSSTLPSGITMRGFYSTSNYAQPTTGPAVLYGSISFNFSLSGVPVAHYIAYNEQPPAECPGSVEHPEASPGHFCVYEDGRMNVASANVTVIAGDSVPSTFGGLVNCTSNMSGTSYVHGTWAVTAP